ncbi:MAG: ABC transporter substrate-binding protein [Ilumatobacteraceae bacterium]
MTRPRALIAAALAAGLALTACSSEDGAPPTTSAPVTTTTMPPIEVGDGRLVIGVLLPTGDAVLGEPMVAAAELATDRINDVGGVFGVPVRVIVADEGDTTATATASIQSLLARDVDAIVGPGSSVITLSSLDDIVTSGTVACSPTASALALDGFPDDDLFFRTVPSDSLQAQAIAQAADQTGALQATIVHIDDAYGRALAAGVTQAMAGGAISVGETIAFSGRDDDLTGEAQQLLASGSPVAIVLADDDDGTRFIEALGGLNTDALATVVVNDAMRSTSSPQRIADLDPELRSRIVGIAPQAQSSDPAAPFDPPGLFASNAYDCVNLIALAAVAADSDAAVDIAGQIPLVSSSGSVCRTFAACVEAIDSGLVIDYNGPSGLMELGRSGDPTRAVFDRFRYGPDGEDVLERTVIVGT